MTLLARQAQGQLPLGLPVGPPPLSPLTPPARPLPGLSPPTAFSPPTGQLLKWIGNKQRFASVIVALFPQRFGTYHEPFVGSGAVLATLAHPSAVASDVLGPLIGIWQAVQDSPEALVAAYEERWHRLMSGDKVAAYRQIRADYNASPNAWDLVMLARSCYGGVIRFAKDGSMNTPCGPHRPVSPESFAERVATWRPRIRQVHFFHRDFEASLDAAESGDLVYCDPPYADSEATLYGAQGFVLERLMAAIARCKARGVHVALSIDGTKRSGDRVCNVPIPEGVFETEAAVDCGRSMLRRFQMGGRTLEAEVVADRLLLTWG